MRQRIVLLLILTLAGTSYAAWSLWTAPASPEAELPPLFVPESSLNLGEVWESTSHTFELPVENRSAAPVEVTNFTPACACSFITVEPSRVVIGAGETVCVRVSLDLTTKPAQPERDAKQDFETSLTAYSGSQAVGPPWVLRGTIRVVLGGGLPRQLECSPVSDLATTADPTVLELTSATLLKSLTTSVEPTWATADVLPLDVNRFRLSIRTKLPAAVANTPVTVRLAPVSQQGEALPPREVKVILRGLTDVQPDTPRILLGTLTSGEIGTAEVGFRSLTGKPFEIEPANSLPAGVTVERRSGADVNSFAISLRGADGSQTVPIDFRVRQPGRSEYTVRYEVAYHGVPR